MNFIDAIKYAKANNVPVMRAGKTYTEIDYSPRTTYQIGYAAYEDIIADDWIPARKTFGFLDAVELLLTKKASGVRRLAWHPKMYMSIDGDYLVVADYRVDQELPLGATDVKANDWIIDN